MKASDAELKQEIDQIKKRVSSLERAFDSVLTKYDSEISKKPSGSLGSFERPLGISSARRAVRHNNRTEASRGEACLSRSRS